MPEFGIALSSEEHEPDALVDYATKAEDVGLDFAMVSDHYHPWIEAQGESPFVWSVLAGIARETDSLRVGTGVTCPTIRIHPAILAQAAATTAVMFDGRFTFGVGTGERLNEHVLGDRWPTYEERQSMLREAVDVLRELWTGEVVDHHGEHYTVENAKLYTTPEAPPDVAVAAGGTDSASVAGEIGDGLVTTAPDDELAAAFADAYADRDQADTDHVDAPMIGQAAVCYAETEQEGRRTVHEQWPNGGLPGELGQELPTPSVFEQAAELVTEEDAAGSLPCGPDADAFVESIQSYLDAGYDHVYLHQIGDDQADFLEFYADEVLPSFD
ncbi:TIGR03557 family F420-dependent LLM class oxidoreductase [Halorubellus sp. JP-L1]|uniref:TIGR03557 family F420-dependent LLM class oxidoreductase n=1 Tax=Halorubellus sp. JP-L1 TaxID=2715753 RepID=UPI00140D8981|nr:TIGR03557 family F420-dependent LLM class oxidoreductase [Halorubellus sp. JP-L1]